MISVLYVDDEPDLLELGRLFLESTGEFSVTTIDSAQRALPLIASGRFDAILSDYQMPAMDGIQFLKEVRAVDPELPFLLFTGRGREEVAVEAINNGADFYVQKGGAPVAQFAELAHKIKTAVARVRAESALRNSEQRQADIINFLPDATFATDGNGVVIAWNRAIEELTGVPAAEMLGKGNYEYSIPFYNERRKGLLDFLRDGDFSNGTGNYKVLQKEGPAVLAETSETRLAGQAKILLVKASLLYNKEGAISGAIESIRDITEAKRAEQELQAAYEQISASEETMRANIAELKHNQEELQAAYSQLAANEQILMHDYSALLQSEQNLRESDEQFRALFESANDAIFLVNEDGTFAQCNRRTLQMFGCTGDSEIIGRSRIDFSPEYQPDGTRSEDRIRGIIRTVLGGEPLTFEWLHKRRDGTPFYTDVTVNAVEIGGKRYMQSIVRDITDRKHAEQVTLLAARRLQVMTDFTRHEITNLVTGINGLLDMAHGMQQGSERDWLNREIKERVTAIRKQIEFTRQYQELGVSEPKWQPVRELIPVPEKPHVIFSPSLDGVEIYADPLIPRVFPVLVGNVVQHGKGATVVRVFAEKMPQGLRILFEDNGSGVPEEMKKKIFERKVGESATMGLFLVSEVLAITGITIAETGTPGRGARFELLVPEGVYRFARGATVPAA